MNAVQQLGQELDAKRKSLADIFVAKPDRNFSEDEVKDIQSRMAEVNDLGAKYLKSKEIADFEEANRKALEVAQTPVYRIPHAGSEGGSDEQEGEKKTAQKSLGEQFIETPGYKHAKSNTRTRFSAGVDVPALGFKTTFTTGGATLTGYDRQPGLVMIGTERLTVADLLAQGQTTMPTIRYIKEDTFTNGATTVAEGAAKPEAVWDTSEADAPVRKIAVTAKVTDELFADFPAIRDYINNRMRYMVELTEEAQLLNGDGVSPNILGILATSGIQTQAKGADPVPDAVYKAMIKVMSVGFFDPTGVVFHPNDWQDVRLLRTADGMYIWGSPAQAGPMYIWGLPVVVTTSMTENTALVGAFRLGAQIFRREGIRVEATNSNEDDFEKNLITIRAEERLALAVYRPKAFCTVTGI